MDEKQFIRSKLSAIKMVLIIIILSTLFSLQFIYMKTDIPLFDSVAIIYPIASLLIWRVLHKEIETQMSVYTQDVSISRTVKITINHSLLLIISVGCFFITNSIISSWYVIFEIYGSMLISELYNTIKQLGLFLLFTIIIMIKSLVYCKKVRLEYISVTLHSVGLICTLICYINVLSTISNIEAYSKMIMKCQIVYIEAIIISTAFLIYCNHIRGKCSKG